MKWLRLYHDTITDPKWRVVANDSGQPEANVLAVWMHMMINASASRERGTLEGWSDRIVAAGLGIPAAAVTAIRDAMQGMVLDGDRLTGWDKRQRASDNVAERVKKHRAGAEPSPPDNGAGRKGNGSVSLQGDNVTLHSASVTEKHLRAQSTDTESKKETGVDLCVELEPTPCAPAREADTHTGAPPGFSKAANIVPFTPPRSPEVLPLPDDWALPDEWHRVAIDLGWPDPEGAAEKFANHWLAKKDRGDRDAANSEAGWLRLWKGWINGNVKWERERGHGQQRHGGQRRQDGGLVAYLKSEVQRNPGFAQADPDDGGWRELRG